jgi:hypothetical protein
MDRRNHKKRITHVLLSAMLALVIVFVGVPLVAAIELENPSATFVLLALIVGSYSTLYLR